MTKRASSSFFVWSGRTVPRADPQGEKDTRLRLNQTKRHADRVALNTRDRDRSTYGQLKVYSIAESEPESRSGGRLEGIEQPKASRLKPKSGRERDRSWRVLID